MMRGGSEAAKASAMIERGQIAKAQTHCVETKNARTWSELVEAIAAEGEWSGILHAVRDGMLAVP